jgi:hypothetical protein
VSWRRRRWKLRISDLDGVMDARPPRDSPQTRARTVETSDPRLSIGLRPCEALDSLRPTRRHRILVHAKTPILGRNQPHDRTPDRRLWCCQPRQDVRRPDRGPGRDGIRPGGSASMGRTVPTGAGGRPSSARWLRRPGSVAVIAEKPEWVTRGAFRRGCLLAPLFWCAAHRFPWMREFDKLLVIS